MLQTGQKSGSVSGETRLVSPVGRVASIFLANSFLFCTQAQGDGSISHDGEGFGKMEVDPLGGNGQNIAK